VPVPKKPDRKERQDKALREAALIVAGKAGPTRLTSEERDWMLTLMDGGASNADVARKSNRSAEAVARVRADYFPTAKLATRYLQANALKLAERIVSDATVEEAIDVLTRPNIGVLAVAKAAMDGQGNVFLSISTSSLGGVVDPGKLQGQKMLPEPVDVTPSAFSVSPARIEKPEIEQKEPEIAKKREISEATVRAPAKLPKNPKKDEKSPEKPRLVRNPAGKPKKTAKNRKKPAFLDPHPSRNVAPPGKAPITLRFNLYD
jgi:hypothetical protein